MSSEVGVGVGVELLNPPQPPPLRRLSSTCDRHPDENFTGFCASCLRERLEGLESSTTATTHRNSTSTISSSLKSIFVRPPNSNSNSSSSLHPQLRRCKSFSCGGGRGGGGGGGGGGDIAPPRISTSFEPQRKSCDVRGRNTLWSLFNQDDNARTTGDHLLPSTSPAPAVPAIDSPVEEEEEDHFDDCDEIRPVDPPVLVLQTSGEINNVVLIGGDRKGEEEEEEEEEEEDEFELKPMKDHIDLDSSQSKKPPPKDFKEIAGSFWLAASVFSKKLQKWRRKQKLKKMKKEQGKPGGNTTSSARFRETQSEVAVDAFGRRSCDTDPRFSLDAGRISFDDARYSLDEPRASWDGYLIGGAGGGGSRLMFPRLPPMLSVVEDVPTPVVQRSDGQIPVEEDLVIPGGSAQTKDYYSDSSSRSRRRSLDRSNSVRKSSVEMSNEQKLPAVANARVSPAASIDLFRDWSSNSLRSDRSESFESAFREDPHKLPPRKKSKRWSKAWSIWGFIHRKSSSSSSRGGANVVDRSFSESWPELRTNGYGNGKILRSNSSVSSRSSLYGNAALGSMRKNGVEMTNGIGKKKKEEFVLERNRSARYSPGHVDNGMLRFYLTPMRNSRRGLAKNVHNSSYQSFTRSVLRLY
ncbi:putative UPF0503 protein, chloroplastic [Iris pallida]|uniref:UPF0503 protein, chloroplastic n=1 Tax=Iris pallida TaxID=29817 RepID=A0AAX6E4A6_IRIPA|nr:putative UPF0503 protein, chloroplastic [Iris pallida]